jgi:hypothetical protein
MKLKLKRSQKEAGLVSKSILFCLDARVELTPEEADAVKKYKLGQQIIYNSEASKQNLSKAGEELTHVGIGSSLKAMALTTMAKMSLNISIDSLTQGHHIECKDMNELLGAEAAIRSACETLRGYLEKANTFDGQEEIIEF